MICLFCFVPRSVVECPFDVVIALANTALQCKKYLIDLVVFRFSNQKTAIVADSTIFSKSLPVACCARDIDLHHGCEHTVVLLCYCR